MKSPPDKAVLFISYWYAPMQGMGVHRVLKACSNYVNKGFDAHVLTSRNRQLVKQDSYHSQAANVEEVNAFDFRYWHALLNRRSKKDNLGSLKKSRWYRWFLRFSQSFPLDMIFGEGGITYIMNGAFRATILIRKEGISHIYSSYSPMADHWIASIIKLLHPRIYWTADFRDQHVDEYRSNTLFPGWQRWIDRQVLKKADKISTVSHGMASQLAYLNKPVSVVYNDHGAEHPNPENLRLDHKLKITYTGSLYSWQDTDQLFTSLARLEKVFPESIELIYAGRDAMVWNARIKYHGLENISRVEGLVSHRRALALQKEADLNLLLTWNQKGSRGVLTGKLFEYIRSENPILAVINGEMDRELEIILAKENALYHIHCDEENIDNLEFFIRELLLSKREKVNKLMEGVHTSFG